jgi:uncharacterized repeat protein (TIGR03803 family)
MSSRLHNVFVRRTLAFLAVLIGSALVCAGPAAASSLKTLYSFCRADACDDGETPSGDLLYDSTNTVLYGTTAAGGFNGGGTVYAVIFRPEKGKWSQKVIYNFCAFAECSDGTSPIDASLIMDTSGALYGTASAGGQTLNGVVFKLTPNTGHTHWTYTKIYEFCVQFSGCEDGQTPIGGLTYVGAETGMPYDGTSTLYGTTAAGGKKGKGVVFTLTPKTDGSWTKTVAYSFCAVGGSSCSDGKSPNPGIVADTSGNLYGATSSGGTGNAGLAYKLTDTGGHHWVQTIRHQFCSATGCTDGETPLTGVIMDAYGNIYGTTAAGGSSNAVCGSSGCGVVYKIDPLGNVTQLYTFCAQDNCADGGIANGLTLDSFGNLWGTTTVGGTHAFGGIFELNPSFQSAYNFQCRPNKGCPQGNTPTGAILVDGSGNVFGSMAQGGKYSMGGTVYELPVPAGPAQAH